MGEAGLPDASGKPRRVSAWAQVMPDGGIVIRGINNGGFAGLGPDLTRAILSFAKENYKGVTDTSRVFGGVSESGKRARMKVPNAQIEEHGGRTVAVNRLGDFFPKADAKPTEAPKAVKPGETFTHEGREYRMTVTDGGQVKSRDLTLKGGPPIVRSWGSIAEFEKQTGLKVDAGAGKAEPKPVAEPNTRPEITKGARALAERIAEKVGKRARPGESLLNLAQPRLVKAEPVPMKGTRVGPLVDGEVQRKDIKPWDAVHPMALKKYEAAMESKDSGLLTQYLHPNNLGLRAKFEADTGVSLKGLGMKATRAAIAKHFEESTTSVEKQDLPGVGPEHPAYPYQQFGDYVVQRALEGDRLDNVGLRKRSNLFFKNQPAQKHLYDAVELGVNRHILAHPEAFNVQKVSIKNVIQSLEKLVSNLPTQTHREAEANELQQYSTPPFYSAVVSWVANVQPSDLVLEPSAGVGGLAVFPHLAGAEVMVNEFDRTRRAKLLEALPGWKSLGVEDARFIHAHMQKAGTRPTVVVMNPPFSSTSGKVMGKRDSAQGVKHIDSALAAMEPGGRLVAIMGDMEGKGWQSWLANTRAAGQVTIQALASVDGSAYRKYGTSFDSVVLVVDKKAPSPEHTIVRGKVANLEELADLLREVRDARTASLAQQPDGAPAEQGGRAPVEAAGDSGVVKDGAPVSSRPGGPEPLEPARPKGQPGAVEAGDPRGSGEPRPVRAGVTPVHGPAGMGSKPSGKGGPAAVRTGEPGPVHADEPGGGSREVPQPIRAPERDGGAGEQDLRDDHVAEVKAAKGKVKAQEHDEAPDSIFSTYRPSKVSFPGAKPHPGELVESQAMAAVDLPDARPTTKLHIPEAVITSGKLSDAQLEAIYYATQATNVVMDDGRRQGFLIGDGTGVGKGREISGFIMSSLNAGQGKGKAVWLSKNSDLFKDATRDWTGIGGAQEELFDLSKLKATEGEKGAKTVAPIPTEKGILFGTYATVTGVKGEVPGARKEQLKAWLGEDFDGVIVLDEAHLASNLGMARTSRGKAKPSQTALGMQEIQAMFPKARVVYVTATVASDPTQLAFLDRLGLWGKGKAFARPADLLAAVQNAGLAGMELVARDLKARGLYIARNLSYNGVVYRTLEHKLLPDQVQAYDIAAGAWQKVLQNVNHVIDALTDGHNSGKARASALSKFYGQQQAFFNSLITSMTLPSAFEDMQRALDAGNSVVIQLTETGEARQGRAIEEASQRAKDTGEDLDIASIDLSPKDILIGFLKSGFPVNALEEVEDDNGNKSWVVAKDSTGNPIQDPEAVEKRDALIAEIATMKLPGSALDEILKQFGTDQVAEITGRSERRVFLPDGTAKIEKRTDKQVDADKGAFMGVGKRVLVFSKAANTGMSFHADNAAENRTKRIHFVLQGGWNAADAIQGLGRTHRTNQAQAPEYVLVTTDLGGHKRFTSTIARRISQLGALTKGQRQASASLFTEKDNLESSTALHALSAWYDQLMKAGVPLADGSTLTEAEFEDATGLRMRDHDGQPLLERPPMKQFLNRVLALPVQQQNAVFDSLAARIEEQYHLEERAGMLEKGLQNIPVEGAKVVEEDPFFKDPDTGAETVYQKIEAQQKIHYLDFEKVNQKAPGFKGFYQDPKRAIPFAIAETRVEMKPDGTKVQHYKMTGPSTVAYRSNIDFEKLEHLEPAKAEEAWDSYRKERGETETNTFHLITGAMLNIWNRFPENLPMDVGRIRLTSGNVAMGRIIPESRLSEVLKQIGAEKALGAAQRAIRDMKAPDLLKAVLRDGKTVSLANGYRLMPVRRSGEYFAVLDGPPHQAAMQALVRQYTGWRLEQFQGQYGTQYKVVVPDGPEALHSLSTFLKAAPVRSLTEPRPGWVRPRGAGGEGHAEMHAFSNPMAAILGNLFGSRQRPDSVSVPSAFEEVERRWREAKKGAEPTPMLTKAIESLRRAKAAFTRHFDHIDPNESPLMAQVHDILRQYEAGPAFAKAVAHDMVYEVTKGLGPKRIDLFTRVLALRDIIRNVSEGLDDAAEELPFGYKNLEEAEQDLKRFEDVLNEPDNAPIREALQKRQDHARAIVENLVSHKLLGKETLENVESYYHRQVMTYLNKRNLGSTGSDVRLKRKGFQIGRQGGAHDFNAAYEQAEAEWVADAMSIIVKKESLDQIERTADLSSKLKAQAEMMNREAYAELHPEADPDDIEEMSSLEIRQGLGDQAVAWRDLIPEDYTLWQPAKGNHFYPALTISERLLDQFLEGDADLSKEDFKSVLAVGGKKKQWAIPQNLATQLDNFVDRDSSEFGRFWVGLQSTWKQWQLISPMRIGRYSLNNMMGDLDIAVAYDPRIVSRHFGKAASEMWSYQVTHKASPELVKEIQDAIRRGVVESGITIAEIPDIDKAGAFRLLTSERPNGNAVQKVWGGLKTFSTWRENVLRLAAYRFFQEELAKGRNLYAASNRAQVDALSNQKDKAAKLARELIGDYGNVSVAGQYIRTHMIPFYSWMEVNAPRYVRLLKNLPHEGEPKPGAGGEQRTRIGMAGRTLAVKAPSLLLRMAVVFGLIYLFNQLFFKDEYEELRRQKGFRNGMILGRREDGSIRYIRMDLAITDALDWLSASDLGRKVAGVNQGKETWGDIAADAAKGPAEKVIKGWEPVFKTMAELVLGRSVSYPSVWREGASMKPGGMAIRDKVGYVLKNVTPLDRLWNKVTNKPARPASMKDGAVDALLAYSVDPGEASYFLSRDIANEWMKKNLKREEFSGTANITEKGNALYYFKRASQWGDKERAAYWLGEFYSLGGKPKDIRESIKRGHPLGSVPPARRPQFMRSLNEKDREVIADAIAWYQRLNPEARSIMAGPAKNTGTQLTEK